MQKLDRFKAHDICGEQGASLSENAACRSDR